MGFHLLATEGTANSLSENGIQSEVVYKLADNRSPTVLDFMVQDNVQLIINTPSGMTSRQDEIKIRSQAILNGIPIVTTRSGAEATVASIRVMNDSGWSVKALQDYV